MLSLSCVLRLFILIAVWLYLIIVMISVIPRAGFSQSSAVFQMCIMCHQPSPSLPFCSSPPLLLLTVAKLPSWRTELPPAGSEVEPWPQSHSAVLYVHKTHLVGTFLVLRSALQWVAKWKPIQAQVESGISLQLTKWLLPYDRQPCTATHLEHA